MFLLIAWIGKQKTNLNSKILFPLVLLWWINISIIFKRNARTTFCFTRIYQNAGVQKECAIQDAQRAYLLIYIAVAVNLIYNWLIKMILSRVSEI